MTSVLFGFRSAPILSLANSCRWHGTKDDRGCHHRTIDLPSLRFLVEHVADRQLRCVLQAHPTEHIGLSASCLRALLAAVVLPMGRRHQSMEGCMQLVERQRASVFRRPPSPELSCTLRGHRHLLALHHDPWATPSCATWEKFRCFHPAAVCLGRK